MEEGGGGGGIRLHVGGLGESVGRDDLLKIFTPMGSVDSIEFVRTKGRSFAYIDFSPSSDNSLTKLFSTYNGCIWKGGRLRLEKAKEHYLARLKREWEESSSTSDDTVKAPDNSTPSTHLNIFFPRLRKVKAMPLSGTGKHKYSFQRVTVPSLLPKSFCDCEEHSTSVTPQETHVHDLEALNVGVNEEEVHIMNSVMNKLFQKNKEQIPEEDSEIEADQDNLIINVVSSGNDMRTSELDILSRKRKSFLNETPASGEEHTGRLNGNHIHASKKRQSVILEESGRHESSQSIREKKKPFKVDPNKSDEPRRTIDVKRSSDNISWSQKSSWKALVASGNNSNFNVSSFLPGSSSSIEVQPASNNTELAGLPIRENLDVPSSSGGSSWLQKASWTQLVSDNNTSFSITQLVPGLTSDRSEAARVNNNGDGQSESGMKQTDGFEAAGVHVDSTPVRSLEENRQSMNGKKVSEGSRLGARKPIRRKIGSGDTCTFMRSAASLKAWEKAKNALSEPRRKKSTEE